MADQLNPSYAPNVNPDPNLDLYPNQIVRAGGGMSRFSGIRMADLGGGPGFDGVIYDKNGNPITGGGGSSTFVGLSDVQITPPGPATGQVVHYNPLAAKYQVASELKVDPTSRDVTTNTTGNIINLNDGYFSQASTGDANFGSLASATNIQGSTDVNITSVNGSINLIPEAGATQIVKVGVDNKSAAQYSADITGVPEAIPNVQFVLDNSSGSSTLVGLTDVNIPVPIANQVLSYNSLSSAFEQSVNLTTDFSSGVVKAKTPQFAVENSANTTLIFATNEAANRVFTQLDPASVYNPNMISRSFTVKHYVDLRDSQLQGQIFKSFANSPNMYSGVATASDSPLANGDIAVLDAGLINTLLNPFNMAFLAVSKVDANGNDSYVDQVFVSGTVCQLVAQHVNLSGGWIEFTLTGAPSDQGTYWLWSVGSVSSVGVVSGADYAYLVSKPLSSVDVANKLNSTTYNTGAVTWGSTAEITTVVNGFDALKLGAGGGSDMVVEGMAGFNLINRTLDPVADTNSGYVAVRSGNSSGNGVAGGLFLSTGSNGVASVSSNHVSVSTGTSGSVSGNVSIVTGALSGSNVEASGNVGNIILQCGVADSDGQPRTGGAIILTPSDGAYGADKGYVVMQDAVDHSKQALLDCSLIPTTSNIVYKFPPLAGVINNGSQTTGSMFNVAGDYTITGLTQGVEQLLAIPKADLLVGGLPDKEGEVLLKNMSGSGNPPDDDGITQYYLPSTNLVLLASGLKLKATAGADEWVKVEVKSSPDKITWSQIGLGAAVVLLVSKDYFTTANTALAGGPAPNRLTNDTYFAAFVTNLSSSNDLIVENFSLLVGGYTYTNLTL